MELTTRLIDLTAGELLTLIAREVQRCIPVQQPMPACEVKEELYGIDGIAEALHCSRTTALRRKASGDLEGGYQQYGNTIIIRDAQLLRDLAEKADAKRKRKNRTTRIITLKQ